MFAQTIIVGRLSKDPEPIANGKGCKLSIPISEKYQKDGQQQERTTWYDVTVWDKQADSCLQHLSKGRVVCVVGKMQADEVERDGVKRRYWGLRADRVQFLPGGDRKDAPAAEPQDDQPSDPPAKGEKIDDDIPF